MNRLLVVSLLAVAACSTPPEPGGPSLTLDDRGAALPFDHPPVVAGGAGGGGGGTGGGGGSAPLFSAGSRRLTTRQLAGSMPLVLDGDTWMIGAVTGFDARSKTLGEPDYLAVVDENLEPSALFLKFMGDAARDACSRSATADIMRPQNERVLSRFVSTTDTVATNRAGVDQNLRYLRLRFHGMKVATGDDVPIAGLRTLFDKVVRASAGTATPTVANVKEGWRAVCVALLMAPEYQLY